jgi:hypothetical protein
LCAIKGHQHQGRGPGGRAGDLVRDAKPGDGRARGDREGQPGAHAADPRASGQDADPGQRQTVGAQVVQARAITLNLTLGRLAGPSRPCTPAQQEL